MFSKEISRPALQEAKLARPAFASTNPAFHNELLSSCLDKAKGRSLAIKSFAPDLNVGDGADAHAYDTLIGALETALNNYNTELGLLDAQLNNIVAMEDQLDALSERMLQGIGAKFGYDSNQYEQAGGTRKSERHPGRPRATSNQGEAKA